MKKINRFKHSGTNNPEISAREKRSAAIAAKAAEESMVLLKNEGLLPLSKGMRPAWKRSAVYRKGRYRIGRC